MSDQQRWIGSTPARGGDAETVHIDCATCPVRGRACAGCLMSAFTDTDTDTDDAGVGVGARGPVPLTLSTAPGAPSGWEIPTPQGDDDLPLTVQERAAVGHAVRFGLIEPERAACLRAQRVPARGEDRHGRAARDAG